MWEKFEIDKNSDLSYLFIEKQIRSQFPKSSQKKITFKILNLRKIHFPEIELLISKTSFILKGGMFELQLNNYTQKELDIAKHIYTFMKYLCKLFSFAALTNQIEYNRYTLIGMMARGLAHEINNPLAIISTYIQLLQMQGAEQEKKEIYENILVAVNRATKIVQIISKFAKSSKDKETINLNEEIQNILIFFENIRKYKFSDIKINYKEKIKDANVKVNKNDLHEILHLLLTNACEAINEINKNQKKISVVLDKVDSNIVLEIADNGIGIKKSNINRVFNPFFSTKEKNTGLGLTLVKFLCDQNNIKIDVSSTYKKGTKILLIFGGIL